MSSYYDNPFAAEALELHVQAIEDIIAPGSTLVDLGCNDERIARQLLNAGIARQVTAIDVNEQPPEPAPNLHFIRADLLSFDLRALPKCDLVLALNVIHHLVPRSRTGAKDLVQAALDIAPQVVLHMGSFTEIGEWPWRLNLQASL